MKFFKWLMSIAPGKRESVRKDPIFFLVNSMSVEELQDLTNGYRDFFHRCDVAIEAYRNIEASKILYKEGVYQDTDARSVITGFDSCLKSLQDIYDEANSLLIEKLKNQSNNG